MILAPQLLQYIMVHFCFLHLRTTIYNCTNCSQGSGVRGVSSSLVTVQAAQQAQEDRLLQHSLPALLLDADELAEHALDGRARHLGQGHQADGSLEKLKVVLGLNAVLPPLPNAPGALPGVRLPRRVDRHARSGGVRSPLLRAPLGRQQWTGSSRRTSSRLSTSRRLRTR